MKQNLLALCCGIIFGLGLAVSQMVNPEKVVNFLDVSGQWDPSLAFVMLGALLITTISFRFILNRPAPLLAERFKLPTKKTIDPSLLFGAAIFGVGWGMAGYCPGPAIAGIGLLLPEAFILVIAIYVGFFTYQWLPVKKD